MTQRVKLVPGKPVSHNRGPVVAPAALLPIQLLANAPGKVAKDGRDSWAPATQVKDQDGAPGSWLGLGPAPAIVASLG